MHAIQQFAVEIAQQLGEGWALAADDPGYQHGATLTHPDGRELFVRTSDGRGNVDGRIEITGAYPKGDKPYDSKYVKIGVTGSKGPAKIAGDITRRLLPEYEAELEKVREHQARHNEWVRQQQDLVRRLCEALPGTRQPRHAGDGELFLPSGPRSEVHGSVRVSSSSVSFDRFSLPADLAVQVFALIATYEKEQANA